MRTEPVCALSMYNDHKNLTTSAYTICVSEAICTTPIRYVWDNGTSAFALGTYFTGTADRLQWGVHHIV